jgi:hypothetical protein
MRCILPLALACNMVPWWAQAQPFDGQWTVLQVCEVTREGARGFTWQYPATVKDGHFAGQYRNEGESPSMSLRGSIRPDGSARLTARGVSGSADFNQQFAPRAAPIAFEVVARFAGTSGTGDRIGNRVCKFTFTRVR